MESVLMRLDLTRQTSEPIEWDDLEVLSLDPMKSF